MCCHRALSLKRPQRRRETSHWSAEQAVIGQSYTSPPLVIVLGKPQMPKTFFELLFFRKICKPHKLFCYGPICSFGGSSLKEKRHYFQFGFFSPLSATRNVIRPLPGALLTAVLCHESLVVEKKAPKTPSVLTAAGLELGGQPPRMLCFPRK